MIKLFKPYMSLLSAWLVLKTLFSGQLAEGKRVKRFEREFAKKFNKKNVLAVNSGTSALELAYELAGIGKGDEVITPILTCTATNLPLLHRGAKIIFADIDYDLNINVEDVKKKITKKTKAIVFVHFGGNNRGLREIIKIAKQHNLQVIEDAAQAVGSDYWGKSQFTCVSLQAIKLLTSGDGGFLLCKNGKDYEKAKRLRWFGIDRDAKQSGKNPDVTEAGYKYHMNDISASIGIGNLRAFDKIWKHRQKLIEIYKSYGLFAHSWLAGGLTSDYQRLKEFMYQNGVEIGQHHYKNSMYTVFKGCPAVCPIMERLEYSYYFVPSHHFVSLLQAKKIGSMIKRWEDQDYIQKNSQKRDIEKRAVDMH